MLTRYQDRISDWSVPDLGVEVPALGVARSCPVVGVDRSCFELGIDAPVSDAGHFSSAA